jgi:hypothetical protein
LEEKMNTVRSFSRLITGCSDAFPVLKGRLPELEVESSGLEENAAQTAAKAERSEILHCLTERSEGV